MSISEQIEVRPVEPFDVRLRVPGSKSLTNRALLLAALAEGESTLVRPLVAEDTRRMMGALDALGFELTHDEVAERVTVRGQGGRMPRGDSQLELHNAGTAMRFLTAACCLPALHEPDPESPGGHTLDGNPRMRQRPIGELVDALRHLGARIEYVGQRQYPPLRVHSQSLAGGELRLGPMLSSQYISALLQVGPYCDGGLTLGFDGPVVSQPYVAMTVGLMRRFGAEVEVDEAFTRLRVAPGGYRGLDYEVEPDASSASYFLAAAAVVPGSRCVIEGLGDASLQGDVGFAQVLGQMGASVEVAADRISVAAPRDRLRGIDVSLNHMPDMAQTLAVAALFAEGATTIRDVGNLRVKETDRIAALQCELTKLGATVLVHGDDLRIEPPSGGEPRPATIDTYDDHRMAMSFAVAGLRSPGVVINDPGCVGKTYPGFFDDLQRLEATAGASE